ncbi:MAG TPA: CRISPR-associated endoribonuclease Cas6 [Clostridia bacterium]|nr:CRISPR-associated endoribonuclease Cas6 [Clostridia bacterium]
MRLLCTFVVKELPVAYRMGIVSIIKESLCLSDADYYEELYCSGSRTKPFVFAPYLRNFRVKDDRLLLDELQVTISSPDHQFLLHLYNGLLRKKKFLYKKYEFLRKSINVFPETPINSPSIMCKTQSPLLIEDKEGSPLAPTSPDYEYHFNYIANMILAECCGRGLLVPLKVEPVDMSKVVVKESNHEFEARFGDKKYLFYTGFQGLFRLTGDPEDLRMLYRLGISKRRNQGFGLFRIA